MKMKKNKIFNSIRKITAPPSKVFEDKKEKMVNKYLNKEIDNEVRYYVDIPDINNHNDSTTFINVAEFYTRKEAINFAKMYYGADDEGKICLISEG